MGGVDLSNNMGIWIGTSDADLQLVVRTGQMISGKVLTKLPIAFGQFDMNEDGVVWIGSFPSRATAVVFSRYGVIGAVVSRRRRAKSPCRMRSSPAKRPLSVTRMTMSAHSSTRFLFTIR
jgi:hypothetical protein